MQGSELNFIFGLTFLTYLKRNVKKEREDISHVLCHEAQDNNMKPFHFHPPGHQNGPSCV